MKYFKVKFLEGGISGKISILSEKCFETQAPLEIDRYKKYSMLYECTEGECVYKPALIIKSADTKEALEDAGRSGHSRNSVPPARHVETATEDEIEVSQSLFSTSSKRKLKKGKSSKTDSRHHALSDDEVMPSSSSVPVISTKIIEQQVQLKVAQLKKKSKEESSSEKHKTKSKEIQTLKKKSKECSERQGTKESSLSSKGHRSSQVDQKERGAKNNSKKMENSILQESAIVNQLNSNDMIDVTESLKRIGEQIPHIPSPKQRKTSDYISASTPSPTLVSTKGENTSSTVAILETLNCIQKQGEEQKDLAQQQLDVLNSINTNIQQLAMRSKLVSTENKDPSNCELDVQLEMFGSEEKSSFFEPLKLYGDKRYLGNGVFLSEERYKRVLRHSVTERQYLTLLTVMVFGTNYLSKHSVTGKCGVSKRKINGKVKVFAPMEPRPALDQQKFLGVKIAFRTYLRARNRGEKYVDQNMSRVNHIVGSKIDAILKGKCGPEDKKNPDFFSFAEEVHPTDMVDTVLDTSEIGNSSPSKNCDLSTSSSDEDQTYCSNLED